VRQSHGDAREGGESERGHDCAAQGVSAHPARRNKVNEDEERGQEEAEEELAQGVVTAHVPDQMLQLFTVGR
jgi:hypothetical protein